MRETLCHIEVFLITGNGVCIGEHLVHPPVLCMKSLFHLGVRESGGQVYSPVTEAKEEILCLFISTIYPCITKAGIHLMDIIERYPCTIICSKVAFLECRPQTVATGNSTNIAPAPFRMVLCISFGTGLQLANEILHPLSTSLIACCGIDSYSCEIVASYMSVESVPVRI